MFVLLYLAYNLKVEGYGIKAKSISEAKEVNNSILQKERENGSNIISGLCLFCNICISDLQKRPGATKLFPE